MSPNVNTPLDINPEILARGADAQNRRRISPSSTMLLNNAGFQAQEVRRNAALPAQEARQPWWETSDMYAPAAHAFTHVPRPVTPPYRSVWSESNSPSPDSPRGGWSATTSPTSTRSYVESLRSSYASVQEVPMVLWPVQQARGRESFTEARPGQVLTTYGLSDCTGIAVTSSMNGPNVNARPNAMAHFAGQFEEPAFYRQLFERHMTPDAPNHIYFIAGNRPSSWAANQDRNQFEQHLRAAMEETGQTYPVDVELVQTRNGQPPGSFTLYPDGRGVAERRMRRANNEEA